MANTLARGESEVFVIRANSGWGSACSGDSGSPFVCNIGGVWKQFGIAG